jgi:thiamine transporter
MYGKVDIPIDNDYPYQGLRGAGKSDPAERTVEHCRPIEPEPDNTGGGKKRMALQSAQAVKVLAEATVFVALTIVLKDVLPPIYEMPQGGAVTIAGLVPLIWFALRRGLKYGVLAGFVYGLIHAFLPGSYIIHPLQGALDYPLAFAALGLAGAFRKIPAIGVAVGLFGRFMCSFVAGIVYFTSLSIDGIYGSAVYNGTYLIPEFFITTVIIYILLSRKLLDIYK